MMRVSFLLLSIGGILAALGGVDGFALHPLLIKPRGGGCSSMKASTSRQGLPPKSQQQQQQQQESSWLVDLMASWFKLPPPPPLRSLSKTAIDLSDPDDDRAIIRKLRESNAELRAEVLAIRAYMRDRGFVPVEDFFADTAATALLSSPVAAVTPPPAKVPPTQPTSKPPSNDKKALTKEARLAALAVLWVAAVSAGGIFIPIAIGEGASQAWRWLDDGGSLLPKKIRRRLHEGGMWGTRGRRWGDAVLSYVPVLRRHDGTVDEDRERLSAGDALAGAWNDLYPEA